MTLRQPYRDRRHLRGTRVHAAKRLYHLRTTTINPLPLLADDHCKRIVLEALGYCASALGFDLIAYVIMPEHVHLVVQPRGGHNVSDFMASFKKYSARRINQTLSRAGAVWRPEFFDHILRQDEHLGRLVDYIHDNPVRWRLAAAARDWKFSSWDKIRGSES